MANNKQNLRDVAQILYLNRTPQKEIAAKLGVSEVTVSRWAKAGNWEALRSNLLTSKKQRLAELYDELEEFNRMIRDKEDYKVANSKEADARRKLIADIEALESKYNIGQTVMIAKDFCDFVREMDFEMARRVSDYFDLFITESIEKQKWQADK